MEILQSVILTSNLFVRPVALLNLLDRQQQTEKYTASRIQQTLYHKVEDVLTGLT